MSVESASDRSHFFDTDDFGTTATFTNPSLGDVVGIFDNESEPQDLGGAVQPVLRTVTFMCKTSDIPGVVTGSTCTVSGTGYTVLFPTDDGTGISTLHLKAT